MQAAPDATVEVKATLHRLRDAKFTEALLADLQAAFRISAGSRRRRPRNGRAAFHDKRPPGWTVR
jgi:hypothetical protein